MSGTRRSAASLILAALAFLSISCFSWRMKDVRNLTGPLPANIQIASLVKKSGEAVLFSKSDPGRLKGYTVVGVARDPVLKSVELTGPFNIMKDSKGRTYEVTDGKGQVYAVTQVLSQGPDRMTVQASAWIPISIPLAEVQQIEVKRSNALRNTAIFCGALVAITLLPLIFARPF